MCGLTTEEIGRAFLVNPPTVAQRIVRAKAKIRDARIPYQVPSRDELPGRLDAVFHVVYLVFNEGYSASSGSSLTRCDVSTEAIRLGRLLVELLPEPEAVGLLALMLLHESRRAARSTSDGELVLLADQDRRLWDRALIAEGVSLVERAISSRRFGPYTLQAAIAAVHAEAVTADETDWAQIVGLYDVLARADPSPVIELNRAAAIAMRDGPEAGLAIVDAHHGARRSRRLSPRAFCTSRSVPASGARWRCARGLSARSGARASGAGEKVFGAEVEGVAIATAKAVGRADTESARSGSRFEAPGLRHPQLDFGV